VMTCETIDFLCSIFCSINVNTVSILLRYRGYMLKVYGKTCIMSRVSIPNHITTCLKSIYRSSRI
jgi:hypothetical protein